MEDLKKEISKLKESGKAIIVEGIKDKRALEKLGLKKIFTLSRKPIYAIVEEVASNYTECVILTDLDKKGKQLYGKLNRGLGSMGVKVDNRFREVLFKKTKLRQIEGLTNYLEKLQT